jgi:Phage head-tail joining protein
MNEINPGGQPGRVFPFGQTVTVLRRVLAEPDEFGNDTYTDVAASVSGVVVQPAGSTETTQFTDQVSTEITVFLPYGTDVGPMDALIINGQRYEIQGIPQQWRSPFSGHTSPLQVRASLVTGASV